MKDLIEISFKNKKAPIPEIRDIAQVYSKGLLKVHNNEVIVKIVEERSNEIHKFYQDFLLDGKLDVDEEGFLGLHVLDFEFMQSQLLKDAYDQKNYTLVDQLTRITALIPDPQIRSTATRYIKDVVCLKTYEIQDRDKLVEMLNFILQEESVHANGKDEDIGIVEDWLKAKKIIENIHEILKCLK